MAVAAPPPTPRPAKELTILEGDGKQTLLSHQKGKVVLIQFLFTTCPHCQALSRELTKLQQQLGPKGVQVFGVAFDEANAGKAMGYVKQYNVGFPVGYASRDTVLNYLGLSVFDRFVVPQIMVGDKKGVVRAQSDPMGTAQLQDLGYLTKLTNELLQEGSGPAKSAPASSAAKSKTNGKS